MSRLPWRVSINVVLKTACEGLGSEEHGRKNLCHFGEYINHYEKAVNSNMEAKGVMKEIRKMFLKMKRDTLVAESSAKLSPAVMWKAEFFGYIAKEIPNYYDKGAAGFMLLLRINCKRKEVSQGKSC